MRNKYLELYKRTSEERKSKKQVNLGAIMMDLNNMYEAMGSVVVDMELMLGSIVSQNQVLQLENKLMKTRFNENNVYQQRQKHLNNQVFVKRSLNFPQRALSLRHQIEILQKESNKVNFNRQKLAATIQKQQQPIDSQCYRSFSSQLSTIKQVNSRDSESKLSQKQKIQAQSQHKRQIRGEGQKNRQQQKSQLQKMQKQKQKKWQSQQSKQNISDILKQQKQQKQQKQKQQPNQYQYSQQEGNGHNVYSITSSEFQDIVGIDLKNWSSNNGNNNGNNNGDENYYGNKNQQ